MPRKKQTPPVAYKVSIKQKTIASAIFIALLGMLVFFTNQSVQGFSSLMSIKNPEKSLILSTWQKNYRMSADVSNELFVYEGQLEFIADYVNALQPINYEWQIFPADENWQPISRGASFEKKLIISNENKLGYNFLPGNYIVKLKVNDFWGWGESKAAEQKFTVVSIPQ